MSAPQLPTDFSGRRARNRRLALVLGLIAAAFYVGFIALSALEGRS